ncbi:MAG: hypothetical protein AB8I69_02710 [Anaerolineae bacterium]
MEARKPRWSVLFLALGLGLGLLGLILPGGQARAGGSGGGNSLQSFSASSLFAAGPAVDGSVLDVSGSSVEPRGYYSCYEAGKAQMLCFTVYNGSNDAEWLDGITMTFPSAPIWQPTCSSGTWDVVDSIGNPVKFTCSWAVPSSQVYFIDNDIETPTPIGEISAGSSWGFCVQVDIPAGYSGPQPVSWELSGDEDGSPPHDIVGETMIQECAPLMLNPSSVVVEGCNGTTQTLTFELWDHHAGGATFHLDYYVPSGNAAFVGPSDFYLTSGSVVTFTAELAPDRCLDPGEQVVASIEAFGGSGGDFSVITHTVTALAGWQTLPYTSPVPSMDSVVVWASHDDGGLWVIGGYGADGATQRYDPGNGTWQTFQSEAVITPLIEYPMDGCYGLNSAGEEIVVLFPDTIVTDTLHVFNITTHQWSTRPIPAFFPPEYVGHWGFDVVSLLNNPAVKPAIADPNMCYLSGGNNTGPGGGTTRNLWRYDPETNGGQYVGNFAGSVWFNFHASWYVPWVGDAGAICVAGGVDHNHQINDTTQCYNLGAGTFNGLNADLGTLPEAWWGMADGWQMYQGQYQIWMANGVAQDGTLLPFSAYASATSGGFQYGPDVPVGLYRVEGDGWVDSFYMVGGSEGGFSPSRHNLLLARCSWCSESFIPLALRNH